MDTFAAADRGDWEAVGQGGVKTGVAAVAAAGAAAAGIAGVQPAELVVGDVEAGGRRPRRSCDHGAAPPAGAAWAPRLRYASAGASAGASAPPTAPPSSPLRLVSFTARSGKNSFSSCSRPSAASCPRTTGFATLL